MQGLDKILGLLNVRTNAGGEDWVPIVDVVGFETGYEDVHRPEDNQEHTGHPLPRNMAAKFASEQLKEKNRRNSQSPSPSLSPPQLTKRRNISTTIATADIPENTTTDWKRLFGVTQYCLPTIKPYVVLIIHGMPRPRKTLTEFEPKV